MFQACSSLARIGEVVGSLSDVLQLANLSLNEKDGDVVKFMYALKVTNIIQQTNLNSSISLMVSVVYLSLHPFKKYQFQKRWRWFIILVTASCNTLGIAICQPRSDLSTAASSLAENGRG